MLPPATSPPPPPPPIIVGKAVATGQVKALDNYRLNVNSLKLLKIAVLLRLHFLLETLLFRYICFQVKVPQLILFRYIYIFIWGSTWLSALYRSYHDR